MYVDACIKEALRLHGPAAILGRHTNGPADILGYAIPPRTIVAMFIYGTQRDPAYWERPEEFLPERFLPVSACCLYCSAPVLLQYWCSSASRLVLVGFDP